MWCGSNIVVLLIIMLFSRFQSTRAFTLRSYSSGCVVVGNRACSSSRMTTTSRLPLSSIPFQPRPTASPRKSHMIHNSRPLTYFLAKGIKFEDFKKTTAAPSNNALKASSTEMDDGGEEGSNQEFHQQVKVLAKTKSVRKIITLASQEAVKNDFTLDMTLFTMKILSSPQYCNRSDLTIEPVKVFLNQSSGNGSDDLQDRVRDQLCQQLEQSGKLVKSLVRMLSTSTSKTTSTISATTSTNSGSNREEYLSAIEKIVSMITKDYTDLAPITSSEKDRLLDETVVIVENTDLMWYLILAYAYQGNFSQVIEKLELLHRDKNKQKIARAQSLSQSQSPTQSQSQVKTISQLESDLMKKILKCTLRDCHDPTKVLQTVSLLHAFYPLDKDIDMFSSITNQFLRKIDFVKGAVSIQTLPSQSHESKIRSEFVFLGRSNVGKSSLINMLTNRKHLAYTSKMPGKTSEFNYFLAEGSIGASSISSSDKEKNKQLQGKMKVKEDKGDGEERKITTNNNNKVSFYLVDVPGVGYAMKSKTQRIEWLELMYEYTKQRKGLQTIFHLIDSRHGLLDADHECLSLLRSLPSSVDYVIVFTKIDKIGTSAMKKALSGKSVMNDLFSLKFASSVSDGPLTQRKPQKQQEWPVSDEILLILQQEVAKHCKIGELIEESTNGDNSSNRSSDNDSLAMIQRKIPVIFTSSETRLGGIDLLMHIVKSSRQ